METSSEKLKDLIAWRLVNQAKENVKQNPEPAPTTAVAVAEQPSRELSPHEFIRVDKNLASLGFFTPSSKRIKSAKAKTITFTRTIDGHRVDATATIVPAALYGLPITADQDKWFALSDLIQDIRHQKGEVKNPVGFSSAELLGMLDKHKDSGKNYQEVSEWLDLMANTGIISEGAVYLAKKKVWARDRFHLFDRAVSFGKELEPGVVADKNYVWLSEWQLENINNNWVLSIDFKTYKQLKNHIAKALVPLLQIWLYATREEGSFEKRYDELCQLLGVTQYKYLSQIKLWFAPSLGELQSYGYISDWNIEKTSDKKSFKVIFYHGEKFHRDRKRLSKKTQPPLPEEPKQLVGNDAELEQGSGAAAESSLPQEMAIVALDATNDQRKLIQRLFLEFKVAITKATELATRHFEETSLQLDAYPYRGVTPKNPAGFIIHAIETNYAPPQSYLDAQEQAVTQAAYATRQATIAACNLCGPEGYYSIRKDGYTAARQCSHDPAIEAKYERV